MFSLPSVPTDLLSAWIQPGAVLGFLGLLLAAFQRMRTEFKEEVRASEARLNKRIDELKEENQASEARQAKRNDELKADMNKQMNEFRSDTNRQMNELRADMKELRADNRALGNKMDRLLEALLPVKQS